jgi:NADPH-dependent 2,4-dienoyl-CoA reductase/sulfur reductase-like enzyme
MSRTGSRAVAADESTLPDTARVVIVGASLAGLRTAEGLRECGFRGAVTVIGDEDEEPYDRPPLSKQVLIGLAAADETRLPRLTDLQDVEFLLGVPAVGLDRARRAVVLEDGRNVEYDRLVVATGVRSRPWPVAEEAALDGVISVRTSGDALELRALLADKPTRVLVIGGGFTGSEVASVCRHLGLSVTLVERGPDPLAGALGDVVGTVAAELQRSAGVDLRSETEVAALDGDGRVRQASLSDGSQFDVDVVVVALGSVRNVEWLEGSRLAAGPAGLSCDAGGRAFDMDGLVTHDIFAVGDVSRFPHPLYNYQFLSLEHWENAVAQAKVVAHNMVCPPIERIPHITVPAFWSIQFGVNIKSVGVPPFGDEILFTQGSTAERSFVAAYGREGRVVAAVFFDQAKWLDFYRARIESAAPFPLDLRADDGPTPDGPTPVTFPDVPYHTPTVILSGHDPNHRRAEVLHGGMVHQ